MNTHRFREWYLSKVQVADQIVSSHGNTAEPDAEILLCCANSGLAALMWPGVGIDKFRFIQFLIEFTPSEANVRKISIPVLTGKLEDNGDKNSAIELRRWFYPQSDAEIVDGEKIDRPETVVKSVLPHMETKDLRASSYAGIIYIDLRCGLVHEYKVSAYLESFSMSRRTDIPSYVNMVIEPDETEVKAKAEEFGVSEELFQTALAKRKRQLHLPYEYVRRVLVSGAEAAFAYWDTSTSWEKPKPEPWWIQG